jgi:hypothetical protein
MIALILALVIIPPVPMNRFPQWQWVWGNGEVIELAQPPAGSVDWSEDRANCDSVWSNTNLYDGNPLADRCEGRI